MSDTTHQSTVRDDSTEERRNLWSIIERAASRAPTEHPEDIDLRPRRTEEIQSRTENT